MSRSLHLRVDLVAAAIALIIGLVLMVLASLAVSLAHAQQPPKPVTYTLTGEQAAALKRALITADFWLNVRSQASPNSVEGHGFDLQRLELGQLFQELVRQETAAAKPAEAAGSGEQK